MPEKVNINKNSISNSKINIESGDIKIGDSYGIDEKDTIRLIKEENQKQIEEIRNVNVEIKNKQNIELLSGVENIFQKYNLNYDLDPLNEHYGSDIDEIKEDIDFNNVDRALKRLINLKEKCWGKASPENKFRILTNLGVVYSITNKPIDAAKYFIDAYRILPENPKAIFNIVIAFIYTGKIDYKIFEELKHKSIEEYTCLDIRFNKKELTIKEIESNLPVDYFDNENILLALANHANNIKEYDKSIQYCKKALKLNDNVSHKENLANSILNKYLNFPPLYFKNSNKYEDIGQINLGIQKFQECWDHFKSGETKKYKLELKAFQSILFLLIGELEKALEAINIPLEVNEKDEFLLKFKAHVLTNMGRFEDAIGILKNYDFVLHPDGLISLSICYFNNYQIEDSIEILQEYITKNINNTFFITAISFLLNIYITSNRISEAEETIIKYSTLINDNIDLLLQKSRFLFLKGEKDEAAGILNEAILKNISHQHYNYLIAQVLEEQGRIEQAIEFYLKDTDLTCFNELTNKIVNLYLKIDRKDLALILLEKLRKKNGIIKIVSKNEIILNIDKGDLKKAKQIADLYLVEYPEDKVMAINLAFLNSRLGFRKEVILFLKEELDYSELEKTVIEIYLYLLAQYGLIKKAYKILYDLWNKNFCEEYNDLLIRFNLRFHISQEVVEYSDIAKEDYAVRVKDANNNFRWFVLTKKNNGDLFVHSSEINKNNVYFKLINHKIGDEVIINIEPIEDRLVIIEIRHKYQYAILKAFENIDTIFKGTSQFKLFSIERLHEFIDGQILTQKERLEKENIFLQHYYEKRLPINFFSNILAVSPIRVWLNFTIYDETFQCSAGFPNEIETTIIKIEDSLVSKELYIDIYTLLTLYKLPNNLLIANSLKIYTSQTTFNIIEEYIDKLLSGTEYIEMRLFVKDNIKHNVKDSKESIKDIQNKFQTFFEWVNENIIVKSSDLFLKSNHKQENTYKDLFGKSSYEAILLAQENNGIAYIDDFVTRNYLCKEFSVNSIWSQALLYYLVKLDKIINVNQDTIQIANLNYRYTAINLNTLREIIERTGGEIKTQFKKVSLILRGDISSDQAVVLGITFLFDFLKNSQILIDLKRIIVTHIISELLKYRILIETYEMIYLLLIKELVNSPNEADFIFDRLREYLKLFNLENVIEMHPKKYNYFRLQALKIIELKKNLSR